ncbi:unnamed protein product, partial [Owenia fusiformis]
GQKGDNGIPGVNGTKGDMGQKGDQGTAGVNGTKGDMGQKGDHGTAGMNGTKGDMGQKGDHGTAGMNGTKGDMGQKGDNGIPVDRNIGYFLPSLTGCGGTFMAPLGNVTSPLYPRSYADGRHCEWTITVPLGNIVRVKFHDFELENCGDCGCDYLAIYNGASTDATRLLGKYCGTAMPPDFRSTGSQIRLVFRTDGSVTRKGFRLSFSS